MFDSLDSLCGVIHLRMALIKMYFYLLSDIVPLIVRKSDDRRSNVRWKVFWKWLLIWAYILQLALCSPPQSSMDAKIKTLPLYNNLQVIQGMYPELWGFLSQWTVGLNRHFLFWSFLHLFLGLEKMKRFLGSLPRFSHNSLCYGHGLDGWEPPQMDHAVGCDVSTTSYDSTAIMRWHFADPKTEANLFPKCQQAFVKGAQRAHLPVEDCVKATEWLVIFCSGCPETKCWAAQDSTTWHAEWICSKKLVYSCRRSKIE